MPGYKEWLQGLRGPRSRRQERAAGGNAATSGHRSPERIPHPRTMFLLAGSLSAFQVLTLQDWSDPGLARFLGGALAVLTLNSLFALYLAATRREVLRSRGRVSLLCLLAAVVLGLAGLYPGRTGGWPPHLLPVTAATVVMAVVFGRRFALEGSFLLLLHVGIALLADPRLPARESVRTLAVLGAGVLAAAVATGRIRTRTKVLAVGAFIGAAHAVTILALHLMRPGPAEWPVLHQMFWGLAHGVLVGFVISGSLPFVEHLFGVSTDLSLLELSNVAQQTVLRRLLLAAPGTYNHSFVVGMLAEEAAEAVGANPLLARVGGYYHDIGKMLKPEYYGENEVIPGLHHRELSPTLSTLIIKSHVKDGAELGRHHDLPRPILDIVREHHGTTLVEHFYHEALKRACEGERVEESWFRYDGPRPRTPEAGIVMLADSVEAAARSLSDPTSARIASTIREISRKKLADGQLDQCGLTLREVRIIEDSFIRVLAGMFHRRPRYTSRPDARGGAS